MEAAKKIRNTAKGQYTRSENRLKAAVDAEQVDVWTLDKRYSELKEKWDKLQDAHDEYASFLTEDEPIKEAET